MHREEHLLKPCNINGRKVHIFCWLIVLGISNGELCPLFTKLMQNLDLLQF